MLDTKQLLKYLLNHNLPPMFNPILTILFPKPNIQGYLTLHYPNWYKKLQTNQNTPKTMKKQTNESKNNEKSKKNEKNDVNVTTAKPINTPEKELKTRKKEIELAYNKIESLILKNFKENMENKICSLFRRCNVVFPYF